MTQPRSLAAGVDVGGTRLKLGLVRLDGAVAASDSIPTPQPPEPKALTAAVRQAFQKMLDGLGADWRALACCGIGCPGPIDERREVVTFAPNLPGWSDVPLVEMLKTELGVPCTLLNDANAAAWGEAWRGAGQDVDSFALYTIGTGVGGGLVLGRKLWSGAVGYAAELGHVCVVEGGRPCGCGLRGCLEAYAAAPAIRREYVRLGGKDLDVEGIAAAGAAGDARAREAFREAADRLGQAIGSLLHTLNLERVLIGGGVAAAGEVLFAPLRAAVARHTMPFFAAGVDVVPAALGNDAGFIGAAGWALEKGC